MKIDELNLSVDELDKLCHLYMDCKLTVLEEKELEFVLTQSSFTSPVIEEVRSLMAITYLPKQKKPIYKTSFLNWKYISGVAASLAVMFSIAYYLFFYQSSILQDNNSSAHVYAYHHGERLNDKEAVSSTNIAMAKADSLMNLASLTEHEYMLKANDIINETLKN